jgi:ABC-type transport system involved in multi-copper enzyme maturation permease subunit
MATIQTLQPARTGDWLTGFTNLFARESRKWWQTRRWWMQLLIWLAILNGFVVFGLFVMPGLIEQSAVAIEESQQAGMVTAEEFQRDVPNALFGLATFLLPVGVIVLVQSQVYAEKRSGVAAWILSKPVARPAYLLAKLLADLVGILLVLVVTPMLLAYLLLTSVIEVQLTDFVAAVGMLALLLLFYQSFTLMMSVLGNSAEVVVGAALGLLLGGMVLKNPLTLVVKDWIFLTPWMLPDVIGLTLTGQPLPSVMLMTLVAVPLWTLICLGVMFRQFGQQEL